jgi:hypothetical protein
MTPDRDTQKVIAEGGMLAELVNGDAWRLAKERLEAMLTRLDSWSTLDPSLTTATAKVKEMETRQHAIALVRQWIRDLEGSVEQGVHTAVSMADRDEPSVYLRFPEKESG